MPVILYIIKVIIIFWFVKFGSELIGEGVVIAIHFACGKNPLKGEMFDFIFWLWSYGRNYDSILEAVPEEVYC